MSNARSTSIIILTVMIVIGICLFLSIYHDNQPQPSPSAAFDTLAEAHQPIIAKDHLSTVAPISTPSPQTLMLPAIPEKDTDQDLHIRVVDALGDLISDATLAIAGEIYSSTNGEFVIHDRKTGAVQAIASARGWEPKEISINTATSTNVDITLEYLCSFEIMITDTPNNGAPVEGIEVILWQGPPILRPMPETVTLKTKDVASISDMGSIAISRASGNPQVVQAQNYGSGQPILSQEPKNPAVGDTLVALSGSCWRPGDQSAIPNPYTDKSYTIHRRVRMWDALVLLGNYGGTQVFGGSLEFERNGVRFKNDIFKVNNDIKGEIAARGVTDQTGTCRFDNLPPRLYFIQGRGQNQRTDMRMLTPIEEGKRLYMHPAGQQSMTVEVLKTGEIFTSEKRIENAQVQLSGQGQHYQGLAKTDRSGLVHFQRIPFGAYELKITPPDALKPTPASKTLIVAFEEWYKYLQVEFGVNTGHQASGVVLDMDTKEPVEGFTMKLVYLENSGFVNTGDVTSRNGGVFQLPNLAPGHYVLNGDADRKLRKDYLPAPTEALYRNTPGLHFEVKDENITGLVFYVMPTVLTRFIGNVVDEEGHGIPGARVTLTEGIPMEEVSSVENGHFELSMFERKNSNQQEAEVIACVVQKQEPILTATTKTQTYASGTMTSFGPLRIMGKITGQGMCPVQYKAGETVEGILVKITKPGEYGRRVTGFVKNKDGVFPVGLDEVNLVRGKQNDRIIRGEVDENGKYILLGINPGPLTILVSPMRKRVYTSGGGYIELGSPEDSYRPLIILTSVPDEPDLTTLDITLEQGSQIKGRIIDEHQQPVPNYYVMAQTSDFSSSGRTDSTGNFVLNDLMPESKYEIAVSPNPSDMPIKKILITTPTAGIVVITIKREQ